MPNSLVFDGITSYTEYPVQKTISDVLGAYQRIVIDGGAISLDHAEDTFEKSHIHLQGDLLDTHAFIKIDNAAGATLFKIGHNGKVHATSGIEAPEITSLQALRASDSEERAELIIEYIGTKAQVAALEAIINSSTQAVTTPVLGSLVQRGQITEFTTVQADILKVGDEPNNAEINGGSIAMWGDTNLTWVPRETVNGVTQNVPGAFVRVGNNQDPLEQTTGDGIELMGPTLGQAQQNHILLAVSQTEPNVSLTANKTNNAPYLQCIGGDDVDSVLELTNTGVSLKLPVPVAHSVIPGGTYVGPWLKTGVYRVELYLNSNWDNVSDEIQVVLENYNEMEDARFFTAEVMIDQSEVEGNTFIESHVYIDRISKNVRSARNTVSIALKMKLLEGETSILQGTLLNLTCINRILL